MMFALIVSWRTSPVYLGMYADIRQEGRGGKYSGMISKASDIVYEYAIQCFVSIILGLSVSNITFGMSARFKLGDSNLKVSLREKQEESGVETRGKMPLKRVGGTEVPTSDSHAFRYMLILVSKVTSGSPHPLARLWQ